MPSLIDTAMATTVFDINRLWLPEQNEGCTGCANPNPNFLALCRLEPFYTHCDACLNDSLIVLARVLSR